MIVKYGSCALDREKKTVLRKTSSLHKLDPFLDRDSIMRVGGQIWKADLSEALKTLIILPKSSHVTSLVIRHEHGRTHHGRKGITVSETYAVGYWIISGNTTVRQFVSKCVTCRYLQDTMGEQKMPEIKSQQYL